MFKSILSYTPSIPNESPSGELGTSTTAVSIGFLEILDLVLVAAIVFFLGFYLMRRRAGKMIVGSLFVVAFLLLCYFIGFPILSSLAENAFSALLLVILILFHDELREVLRQIGCLPEKISSFIKKKSTAGLSKKTANAVKEICDAAVQMAEEKTGALIVLKRASGLQEYTVKGRALDAEVSSALIRTIFYNGSPLHDGAMIIENGRIRATSCQLPPADPEGIDDSLGERHKAAIGISECTDAVAIVVSEETGTISIALGDEMKRGYSYKDLHAELTALLSNYNTKLEDWEDGSSPKVTTTRKHKKPDKEKHSGETDQS